jgi:hypothetical protein
MTTAAYLREARQRIERGWCQGTWARTGDGAPTHSQDERANQWCALGALSCVGALLNGDNFLHMALPAGWKLVGDFNDAPGRTKEDILALYDRAIALAERQEAS